MTNLYTVLLDYAGGTYVSQVSASQLMDVLPVWSQSLSSDDLMNWQLRQDEVLALITDCPVPLDGLQGVWCASTSAKRGLALINIVLSQTSN